MAVDVSIRVAFFQKDYELKIGYLISQFDRSWRRFQFLITLEAGLLAAFFGLTATTRILGPAAVPIVGALISIVWFAIGAQDKFVVEVYRNHVKASGNRLLKALELDSTSESIEIIGEIYPSTIESHWYQWRNDKISSTKLLAIFPVIFITIWIILCLAVYQ